MVPAVTHLRDHEVKYRDPLDVAREKVHWILDKYQPTPLESAAQAELAQILAAADRELA
jgi:hypothetical protein